MIFSSQNLPIIMMVVDVVKNNKTYKEPHVIMRFFCLTKIVLTLTPFLIALHKIMLLDNKIKKQQK